MVWLNGSGGYAPGNQIGNATTRKPMSPSLIRDLMLKKVPPWVASQSVGIEHAGATGYHWDTRKQIRRACDTARL
jgi:hypothetical protein